MRSVTAIFCQSSATSFFIIIVSIQKILFFLYHCLLNFCLYTTNRPFSGLEFVLKKKFSLRNILDFLCSEMHPSRLYSLLLYMQLETCLFRSQIKTVRFSFIVHSRLKGACWITFNQDLFITKTWLAWLLYSLTGTFSSHSIFHTPCVNDLFSAPGLILQK